MEFIVTILGSGASLPTKRRQCSAQVIKIGKELLLVDCGEGTQLSLRREKVKFSQIHSIFISHLHGDHFLGLPGLLFSMHLLGRKEPLSIFSPKGLKPLLDQLMAISCSSLAFPLIVQDLSGSSSDVILEKGEFRVKQIRLRHSIETFGFIFEEKSSLLRLLPEARSLYPLSILDIQKIKNGEDYVNPLGKLVPNQALVFPSSPLRKYAYCSDTAYMLELPPLLSGVTTLFHEATFMNSESVLAEQKLHSTSLQAAQIALIAGVNQLVIGHISARYKDSSEINAEVRTVFLNSIVAEDGMRICV